ncbi:TlpA disulfide reductase family protein [Chitinophaga caseinilytica]|uniref:TlpA disulfide reductase family protein n=1 Tax=Chitinophaga caseinilytica TaxID=2267521 RepID=A0ABZ2ZEY3_9BACT
MRKYTLQKLIFLSCCLLPTLTTLASNQINYTVKGKIKGLPDGTRIYLIKTNNETKIDTIGITFSKNESFHLSGTDDIVGKIHALAFDQSDIKKVVPSGLEPMPFIIENNNFSIQGNLENWPVVNFINSKTNENYHKLIDEIRAINKDMRLRFPKGGDAMDSIYTTTVKKALLKYPDSYGTSVITELFSQKLGKVELAFIYSTFSNKVKESYYGQIINKTLHYLTDAHNIMEGKILPDFKFPTESGDSISILQYAATKKYVLIDIWASWCTPCREEIPNLKEVYKIYGDNGLGIVSISIDKNEKSWKSALSKEAMPWVHTIDPDELISGNIFRVSSIPVYILIDNQGKLISFQSASSGIQSFGPELRDVSLRNTLKDLFRH